MDYKYLLISNTKLNQYKSNMFGSHLIIADDDHQTSRYDAFFSQGRIITTHNMCQKNVLVALAVYETHPVTVCVSVWEVAASSLSVQRYNDRMIWQISAEEEKHKEQRSVQPVCIKRSFQSAQIFFFLLLFSR